VASFCAIALLGLPMATASSGYDPVFGDDVEFLRTHTDAVVLSDARGRSQVVVVPQYQGRVMTSTAGGPAGFSFGWINRTAIASGQFQPHINVWGGEDRFWLGPEGGPFSLFFAPGVKEQTLEHWQTPAIIDTDGWAVVRRDSQSLACRASGQLTNRVGTVFAFAIDREVRLLEQAAIAGLIGKSRAHETMAVVAFESINRLTNQGPKPWRRDSGLPSIWILGMFKHGPGTTVVIPYRSGPEKKAGPAVRSDYFGEVPATRLAVDNRAIYYRADGQDRGKIGVAARRSREVCGSWDADRAILTLVRYTLPRDAPSRPYVDSRWQDTGDPYAGDVVNAYNDGPPAPGAKPFGPFYEIESSSPAADLAPGAALEHTHQTYHLSGSRSALDRVAKRVLGVSLDRIERALPRQP
jgi:hypothetical protein